MQSPVNYLIHVDGFLCLVTIFSICHCAAANGATELLYELEVRGANPWLKSEKDEYPVHEAMGNNFTGLSPVSFQLLTSHPETCDT